MPFGGLLTAGVGLAGAAVSSGLLGGKKASEPKFTITNPALGPLASLFGATVRSGRDGGVSYGGSKRRRAELQKNAVFGGADFNRQLSDFLFNPAGLSAAEQGAQSFLANPALFQGQLAQAQQGLGQLAGYGQELARTGFETDATPLFQRASQLFSTQALPEIAERIGSQVGLGSQSFIDAAQQASTELLGRAAEQGVGLREAAAQRRVAGLPLATNLQQQQLSTPLAAFQDLLGLGGTLRSITEEGRSRPFTAFQSLAGMSPGISQGYALQGYDPQGSGRGQALGALASSLPGVLQGLGGLLGGGGPPGGGIGGGTVNTGNLNQAVFGRGSLGGFF